MKATRKLTLIVLLLAIVLSFPGIVLAKTDEYGYNAKARTFKGTLDNWEAFLAGTPPTPYDPKGTDIIFVERKWNILFDPLIKSKKPSAGAWQKAKLWEYLSGEKLGWTWHLEFEIFYSPKKAIPGAIEVPLEAIGYPGFYVIKQEEWLAGPNGEKEIIQDFSILHNRIKKALNCKK
ncbi:hypothetical protein Sgly_3233 [Syntrophobotulus glycolicus DSM 8271]|uniref:Uncharacterized protein n=1 Tax=Syntrophobotulus glycolicus (strain DSM 8271 / FlGlyR) TaxID=645991 RepID=F0T1S3_SYNGF|nr:hypothetical protein [Syntrophobotulus glycolicus]ADY57497.1 hypothetical protein Sgly_3233 [Syntrophobotulus glycolicus DSM 8271]